MKVLSFLKISGEFFLDYERDLVDLVSIFCYNITTFVKELVFFLKIIQIFKDLKKFMIV